MHLQITIISTTFPYESVYYENTEHEDTQILNNQFIYTLDTLHEVLFNSLVLIFYQNSAKSMFFSRKCYLVEVSFINLLTERRYKFRTFERKRCDYECYVKEKDCVGYVDFEVKLIETKKLCGDNIKETQSFTEDGKMHQYEGESVHKNEEIRQEKGMNQIQSTTKSADNDAKRVVKIYNPGNLLLVTKQEGVTNTYKKDSKNNILDKEENYINIGHTKEQPLVKDESRNNSIDNTSEEKPFNLVAGQYLLNKNKIAGFYRRRSNSKNEEVENLQKQVGSNLVDNKDDFNCEGLIDPQNVETFHDTIHLNSNNNDLTKMETTGYKTHQDLLKILKILQGHKFVERAHNRKNFLFDNLIVNYFLDQKTCQTYSSYFMRIWRICSFIFKGSFYCRYNLWCGLIILENFYRQEAKKYDIKNLKNNVFNDQKSFSSEFPQVSYNTSNVTIERKGCTDPGDSHGSNYEKTKNMPGEVERSKSEFLTKNLTQPILDEAEQYLSSSEYISRPLNLRKERIGFANSKNRNSVLIGSEMTSDYKYDVFDGYSRFSLQFYNYFHNKYFFAITSYGRYLLKILGAKPRVCINKKLHEPECTILAYLNIQSEHLLSIKLKDTQTPHLIFYDKIEDELVVSIRGTENHYDALNDLDCEYTQFFEGYAHTGFVKRADYFIDNHLKDIKKFAEKLNVDKILFTGQSLGAAVSIICYIKTAKLELLCNLKLRVITFSSPPAVSYNFCRNDEWDITNIVYGYDVVSRLSFGSILDLKYLAISCSKLSKKQDLNELVPEIKDYLEKKNLHPKLYIPGKLYHIRKFNINNKMVVMAKMVDSSFFSELIVHKMCFFHHSFSALQGAIEMGIKQEKFDAEK